MVAPRREERDAFRQGFVDLCKDMGVSPDGNGADEATARTSTRRDRMLHATNRMNATSSRLDNAAAVLQECILILKDRQVGMTKREQMASMLHNLILPLCERAATCLSKAALDVAPIAGTSDNHSQMETDRKKAARREMEQHPNKKMKKEIAIDAELISEYLRDEEKQAAASKPNNITPRSKSKRKRKSASKVTPPKLDEKKIDVCIPSPANGDQYTKSEACKVVSENSEHGSPVRAAIYKEMIEKKYVFASVELLRGLVKKYENDQVVKILHGTQTVADLAHSINLTMTTSLQASSVGKPRAKRVSRSCCWKKTRS